MKENKEENMKIKWHRSIKGRTFFAVMALTFAIGAMMLVVGIILFLGGVLYNQYIGSWDMASAEAMILNEAEADGKINEIIDLYDSIPEEERGDGQSEEYRARFEPLVDDEFMQLKDKMHKLKRKSGTLNAYVVAIDDKYDKMINIIDSDTDMSTFVYPGTWDYYDENELKDLVFGNKQYFHTRILGNKKPQATITSAENYGLRITGAATLFKRGKYTVLVCIDNKTNKLVRITKAFTLDYLVLLFVVTLIASLIGVALMNRQLIKPITIISNATRAYSEDTQDGKLTRKHFENLEVRSDEIGNLTLTLKDMEKDISNYAKNLTAVTAEKERISTELSVAAKIQESVIPSDFPPYPDRNEFDIFASMDPAKEVGGDFYDFYLIDDDHVGVAIADVSGKGIPAALFMMASKILISGKLVDCMSPEDVLKTVNDLMCEGNHEDMFVTVWLGILEISTGKLTAANAGHEYPIIIDENGVAQVYKDKHGFVVGGMEGMKYTNYEIQLKPGQKVFVYTDGLTEATSTDQELFGMDRIVDAINELEKNACAKDVLDRVNERVDEFVAEAEQFDDLTMLCLEYHGEKGPNHPHDYR